MNERLKSIRKSMNMNQTEFAQLLGIGQSTLAMMEVNKRDISDRHIKTICAICNVNEVWFRTGDGEMLVSGGDGFISDLSAQYQLTPVQQSLIRAVYEMPPELQDMVIAVAQQLVAEQAARQLPADTHERIERITNAYLDECEAQPPGEQTDKRA